MNDPKDVVAFYLQRIKNASHPVEKRLIKGDLFLYYHRLTDAECEAVRLQMQPLLDEKRIEMEEKDPMLKRAGELLRRLEAKSSVISL
ncbi:hypothetical protein [Spirosoma areae]